MEQNERGFYWMRRGAMAHPLFQRHPFSRFQAWEWLIAEAAWRSGRAAGPSRPIRVGRGQLSCSIRFMAEAWKWPKSTVARFLRELETEAMITRALVQPLEIVDESAAKTAVSNVFSSGAKPGASGGTRTGRGQMVITICNYDHYQAPWDDDKTENGTRAGTVAGQSRDSRGTKKNKDNTGNTGIRKNSDPVADATDAAAPVLEFSDSSVLRFPGRETADETARRLFWTTGRSVLLELGTPEKAAGALLGKLLKATGDDVDRAEAALAALADRRPVNPATYVVSLCRAIAAERESDPAQAQPDYDWRNDPNLKVHL